MHFTNCPTSIRSIQYGAHRPGLGHQITSLCYELHYCRTHNIYPVIKDDPTNAYGRWTDYFEPFWDDDQRQEILAKFGHIPVIERDLVKWNASRALLFGQNWADLSEDIKEIFLNIFVIKEPVRKLISAKIQNLDLPDHYSSVHVRRGDKNDQFKEYGQASNLDVVRALEKELIGRSVVNVFLMTDDYQIVELMRNETPFHIFTLCSPSHDGNPDRLRKSQGHTLDLLTDISIAQNAVSHFQTVNTRVSKLVRILRGDNECFHIFDKNYTVDTAL